jgi:hypothetical protein
MEYYLLVANVKLGADYHSSLGSVLGNPVSKLGSLSINSGMSGISATNTPGYDAAVNLISAGHRSTRVSLARVLALLTSTDHGTSDLIEGVVVRASWKKIDICLTVEKKSFLKQGLLTA